LILSKPPQMKLLKQNQREIKYNMNKRLKGRSLVLLFSMILSFGSIDTYAGNEDRVVQSGASQLQIKPCARSKGFGSANTASVIGLESVNFNVAGLAFTRKTEVMFAHTRWLSGSDIGINAFGLSQRVGETGVLGLNIMSLNFGDIVITTVDKPEGGIGTYSPHY